MTDDDPAEEVWREACELADFPPLPPLPQEVNTMGTFFRKLRPGWNTPFGKNPITLLAIAVTAIWRGWNYVFEGIPGGSLPPIEMISGFVPMNAWPVAWIVAGHVMIAGFVWRRLFAAGASFVAVLWALWGIAFLWASFAPVAVSPGAEVTGAGFLALGLAAWTLASDEVDFDDEVVRRESAD